MDPSAKCTLYFTDGAVVIASLEWEGRVLRAHLLAGRGLGRSLAPGDTVALSLKPEDVHWMQRRNEDLR